MPAATAKSCTVPRVVILGAGFGGLFTARGLCRAQVDVTIIDRNNYHQFQPLLYQVAGAALAPSDVAWPIRALLKHQKNTRVLMAEITGVDRERRRVLTDRGELEFDYLVVATGSQNHYFDHPEWAALTVGLKDLQDATNIRARVLRALERAESSDDGDERRRLLNFVVIGGGPTGVETAGIIAELGHRALASDFRRISKKDFGVVLTEGSERLLSAFPEKLAAYTRQALERLGVRVITGRFVTDIRRGGVEIGGEIFPSETVLWCAGVAPTPVAHWLGCSHERGLIPVTNQLRLPDDENIFVIGDVALSLDSSGRPLPGVAPVAKQEGRYVANLIGRLVSGKAPGKPFRYRNFGMLATIGRGCAVADFGFFTMKGHLTWWLWGISHIYFLIARQLRWMVALKWLFEYFTYQRGSRLILK